MKYDDASWHYGGDFPADLPESAASTHIAIFAAWAVLNGLASDYQLVECAEELSKLRSKALEPVSWFIAACDEKFTDEDLGEEGNAFCKSYYSDGNGLKSGKNSYISDYSECFTNIPSLYHVPANWTSYERLSPILSHRLEKWRASKRWNWLLRR